MLSAICLFALLATFVCVGSASGEYIAVLQIHNGNPDILWDTNTYTVQQLKDNGGYVVGDKFFRWFDVTPSGTQSSMGPDASEITVRAVMINGDYGLKFNGIWMAAGGQKCDSTIQFEAVILDDFIAAGYRFKDNRLYMTAPGESGTTNGKVSITENLFVNDPSTPNNTLIASRYVYYNDSTPGHFDLDDYGTFAPRTSMWVVKDVGVDGGTLNGSVSISEFYQTFSQMQVPEPGTLALLGFGAIGLIAYAWRKRR